MRYHKHLLRHIVDWVPTTPPAVVTSDTTVTNRMKHIVCSGTLTITLPVASVRNEIITITNTGTGTITVEPQTGEVIKDLSTIDMAFQWSTMQLLPVTGGYVII